MNSFTRLWRCVIVMVSILESASGAAAQTIPVDFSGYAPSCGVEVKQEGDRLLVAWPIGEKEVGRLVLDLRPGQPLIDSLGIAAGASDLAMLLRGVEPVVFLTVGTRQAPAGRPPQMSIFNT